MPLFPGSVLRVSVSFGGPFLFPLVVGYGPIFAGAVASAGARLIASAGVCLGEGLALPAGVPADACSALPAGVRLGASAGARLVASAGVCLGRASLAGLFRQRFRCFLSELVAKSLSISGKCTIFGGQVAGFQGY